MKLWLKKVKTLRSSKAKKAELAEASVDAPQPARGCEGAHWRKGIPWGALAVPPVKRHTSCMSSLRTEAGRTLLPLHCPFWNLPGASGFWLWSLIPTGFLWELQVARQGLRLSSEEGPWHCVADFDLQSGYQGPSRDIRCSRFLRDRQKSSRGLRAFCQLSC